MSAAVLPLPVRKLCSCNAVLCAGAAPTSVPGTDLFGVILLNSPANTDEDFAEYLRLHRLYRPSQTSTAVGSSLSPYFICADGAYDALTRYCTRQAATAVASSSSSLKVEASTRLCDVMIGDMDSISRLQLCRLSAAAAAPTGLDASSMTHSENTLTPGSFTAARPCQPGVESGTDKANDVPHKEEEDFVSPEEEGTIPYYHETVAAIPVSLLEDIRARRDKAARHTADTPLVLPIACQMSTDFHKCVALLERLRRLEEGNTETLSEEEQVSYYAECARAAPSPPQIALLDAYAVVMERACEESTRQAGDDAAEAARCRRLLSEVSFSTPTVLETRVLPNIAVLGALGGRIDHEIGVMACVIRYSRTFHVLVVNAYNVLFACWPDGVTQLIMPPEWVQPRGLVAGAVTVTGTAPPRADRPHMCGIVPFGPIRAMETAGCLWNVVKGHPERYDGFTRTTGYRMAMDDLVSVCNTVTSCIVTADLRPVGTGEVAQRPSWDPEAPSLNPPTLFMIGRPKSGK